MIPISALTSKALRQRRALTNSATTVRRLPAASASPGSATATSTPDPRLGLTSIHFRPMRAKPSRVSHTRSVPRCEVRPKVPSVGLLPGDVINVRFTKWCGRGHWEFAGVLLGCDEHGTWVGGSTGTQLARPGNAFKSRYDWVTLFPESEPWVASFRNSLDTTIAVYVDITTAPVWSGPEVSMVDLDLDVLLMRDGTLLLDDEDEFDEHRVTLAYPDELVDLARHSAHNVMTAVGSRLEPFGDVGRTWLSEFTRRDERYPESR